MGLYIHATYQTSFISYNKMFSSASKKGVKLYHLHMHSTNKHYISNKSVK